jgi:hypothetical protein
MISELVALADKLDKLGNTSEANKIDFILKKYAQAISESGSQQVMVAPSAGTKPKPAEMIELQKSGLYRLGYQCPEDSDRIGEFKLQDFVKQIQEDLAKHPERAKCIYAISIYTADSSGKVTSLKYDVRAHELTKDLPGLSKVLSTSPAPVVPQKPDPVRDAITAGYYSYKNQFNSCVTTRVNANPSFSVKTTIKFTVGKDGTTSNHSAVSVPENREFDACLLQKMITWKFRPGITTEPYTFSGVQGFGRQQ